MNSKISASSSSSVSDLIWATSDGLAFQPFDARGEPTGHHLGLLKPLYPPSKIGHLGLSAVTFVQLAALCRFGRGQLAGPDPSGTRRATSAAALETRI